MGVSQKVGNGTGKWELNRWEWEGMGMLKAFPAHLYRKVLLALAFATANGKATAPHDIEHRVEHASLSGQANSIPQEPADVCSLYDTESGSFNVQIYTQNMQLCTKQGSSESIQYLWSKSKRNLSLQMRFGALYAQNAFAAGALPQIPLAEHTVFSSQSS